MRSIMLARTIFAMATLGVSFERHTDESLLRVDRKWYATGQLAEERSYVNGREQGVHRGWWPNGKRRFEYEYGNGLLEGESREWFESGALWRDQHYSAGHEAGLQRLYWDDGRVRASYEVRVGRRYGLMGAKGCVAKPDSAEAST